MCPPSRQSISVTIKTWIKINKRVIKYKKKMHIGGTVIDENLTWKTRFCIIKSKFLKHQIIGIMFIVRP